MMTTLKKFFKQYGFVLLVGAYFALTSIYSSFGSSRDVFWNTYIKTVRECFIIALVLMHFKKLQNVLSILMGFGFIAVCSYRLLFRWLCAHVSSGDYEVYFEYMKSPNQSLMYIIFIFSIFVLANYLNSK